MMKKSFLNLLCIGCVACAFTACSDDDNSSVVDPIDGGQGNRGEETTIQFRLAQSSPGTYAYNGEDPATTDESEINGSVRVFVFDDYGMFEKSETLIVTPGTGSNANSDYYDSEVMAVSSGIKYFYVFANMDGTVIADPASGSTRQAFETRELINAVSAMTIDEHFYIGTLQPTATTIIADATSTQQVTVQIGRLSAKVLVKDKAPDVKGDILKGTFEFADAEYRLVNIPSKYYLVGQPSTRIGNTGNYMVSPYFYDTTPITGITGPDLTNWTGTGEVKVGNYIYTKENTREVPLNGSATSAQYRVQYKPAAVEIYDPSTGTNNASLTGETFWMASVGDLKVKYIFNDEPTGTIPNLGTVDATTVVKYEDGYSYYVIPITDQSETVPAARYSVIRNHSYLLTLSTIARLGSGNPDITDPEIPIGEEYDIEFLIEVLPWYKVEQVVDL